jgi:type II secretion system protein F
MPDFRYLAMDRSGNQVTGSLAARDTADAVSRMRGQGLYPVEVTEGSAGRLTRTEQARPKASPAAGKSAKVGRMHILLFTREMADLIDAGLPIDRGLSVLIEQSDDDALRAMVTAMREDVRAGKPLSEALQRFPREFPPLYANMIRAGEVAGQLPQVMARLADFLEKEHVRRAQVVAALTYPSVLISVAVLAVTFLLTFVIPRLQDVFRDLGADLPLPTQMLLGLSAGLMRYWWAIGGAIAGGVLLFRAWVRSDGGRHIYDGFRLSAPLFGVLATKLVMARFVRTLGTLLAGGVPILEALAIAATAVGNAVASDRIGSVLDAVRQGETLAAALETTGGFLPLVVHMTAVGEETGRLPKMLIRTSDTLDMEVDNAMRRLTSLVEPLVVLLMGGFVGFVVLSILLPIFQANTIVK